MYLQLIKSWLKVDWKLFPLLWQMTSCLRCCERFAILVVANLLPPTVYAKSWLKTISTAVVDDKLSPLLWEICYSCCCQSATSDCVCHICTPLAASPLACNSICNSSPTGTLVAKTAKTPAIPPRSTDSRLQIYGSKISTFQWRFLDPQIPRLE